MKLGKLLAFYRKSYRKKYYNKMLILFLFYLLFVTKPVKMESR